jgi:hypothetical protein
MKRSLAVALTVGLIASLASAVEVESQNTVGYNTISIGAGDAYTLVGVNWADIGQNPTDIQDLFGNSAIPDLTEALIWNGSGYDTWTYFSGDWYDPGFSVSPLDILPGDSFWIHNTAATALDLTVAGEVYEAATAGQTFSGEYTLFASAFSANDSLNGGSFDWSSLVDLDEALIWTGSGYDTWTYFSGDWYDPGFSIAPGPIPMGTGLWFHKTSAGTRNVTQTKPY